MNEPEVINKLTSKSGVEKGRKSNIKIGKTRKSKTSISGGVLSGDQKWRVYKSDIEPQLSDRNLQEEPNSEMLATIRHALNETGMSNVGKILKDTNKDTETDVKSDIVSPSQIGTSYMDKMKAAYNNENELSKKETERIAAISRLQSASRRKGIENEVNDIAKVANIKPTFKELRVLSDIVNPENEGEQINEYHKMIAENNKLDLQKAKEKRINKQLKTQNATIQSPAEAYEANKGKIKRGYQISIQELAKMNDENKRLGTPAEHFKKLTKPADDNKNILALNNEIDNLMKTKLSGKGGNIGKNKSTNTTQITTKSVGTDMIKKVGAPSTADKLTKLANTFIANPRNINRKSLNTSVYQSSTPDSRRFQQFLGFSPNPYLNIQSTPQQRALARGANLFADNTPPSKSTRKISKL